MAKIIICEDEHIVALDMRRQLERFGYQVVGAYTNAEEAIEACAAESPDLVLMDIQLQGKMDGVEASRRIYATYAIPVILITAFADDATIARARNSLPFGYIIKPFEERELRTAIEIALLRSEMERKLRQSEERYRSLFLEAPTANFTAAADGRLTDCNGTFLALLAYPDAGAAVGASLLDRFGSRAEGEAALKRSAALPPGAGDEWTLQRLDGETVYVLATLSLLPGRDGGAAELRGYLVDITERRELEAQLRQSQKMEAIGRLAGGIAHDFNNIITAIMGYCNLLAEDVGDNATLKDEVDGILSSSRRAVNLTRQLLSFSRKQPLEPRVIDVNETLRDLEKMVRRLLSENLTLKFFLDAQNPYISIDPGQFEQIIINLVVNAKDAVTESGAIVVETRTVKADGSGRCHGIAKGEWLLVVVRDNGSGISPDDLQRIFEPFFTTKPKNQGTGLGLSTVYTAVNRAGGMVTVESERGRGTAFSVYLPVVGPEPLAEAATEAAVPAKVPQPPRRGTILLAEDDAYLRGLLAKLLAKAGYRVLEAETADQALTLAAGEQGYTLLTDIVMPRMNGYELANRLKERNQDLRVLFMSGYHDQYEKPELTTYARSGFIQKPFSHDQLLAALDGMTG